MKPFFALCAAGLLATGCATEEAAQVAQAECKVAPITTTSMTWAGKARPVSDIDQRYAEMQLASTDYRFRNLQRNGITPNLVEDVLRDCK